jgi:hydroxymethylpyrimidine pyrophosphatase-like HAD family hydrolase
MPTINETGEFSAPADRGVTGIFITDLDGTLLRSDRTVAEPVLSCLRRLGELGIARVIATGRSLFSFNTVAAAGLPVDFVIFSTGAGVADYPHGKILRSVSMETGDVRRAFEALRALELDFMVQRPIPDSHVFGYVVSNSSNPDFERRIALYSRFAFPWDGDIEHFGPATQLVAIVPPDRAQEALTSVRRKLASLNVIQTTSPLDGQSTWIEIFPAGVSKSSTADWLASKLGVSRHKALAVGNDFNDLDLLEWAQTRFVVANAPPELTQRFPVVASNNDNGVVEAIAMWLGADGLTDPSGESIGSMAD